ncbi:formyl-CoA transferase [Natronocella acetinitrilica]|uniref:Formyl-CoA transferase n=1 Tax=Natronocella acetinitrilica TaxID=414046 RepID=A0AAE3G5R8_9GAMM|nr:CoA transferase [Natronocella acetinitrilica]MCP1674923.1 formyl-CoA transferase [Natronocella acetinitrilica]
MLPLDGLRVLDISQIMAGPYCTMVLGDMGAEVIKVEKAKGGDDSRQMGPYVEGESMCFVQINRNKKSIALNLKDPDGREIFYQLAREADVIVENYRPGVTQSLKVDFETIRGMNPGIIYCSISGFGQTGPYREKGGFDLVAQGMTGLMSMTGEAGKRPMKTGIAVYDIGAGITAVYSILAAYIHRQKTGEGQHIDIAVAECGLPWFTWEAAGYFGNGTQPEATGWRHRVSAPYQSLRTADGYLMLGCANQRTWERFCQDVVNRPEWMEDRRFVTNQDRRQNVEALEALIEEILAADTTENWLARCDAAGVPAGPVNTFEQALQDKHYQARGMVQSFQHPTLGKVDTLGFASKFSSTPQEIRQSAPLFAQHTDEVLEELGLDASRIAALRAGGAVV